GQTRYLGGEEHAHRDRGTMTPAVTFGVFDRVTERVAVIENLALAGLAEILRDDARLHIDGEFDGATELIRRRVDCASGVGFDDVEDLRSPDEPCLDDLSESCCRLVRTETAELVEVADHGARGPESTDEVLALVRVHSGLTADRGI